MNKIQISNTNESTKKPNRIDRCFTRLALAKRKALILFLTAGDPDLATTERLVLELEQKGADIIELGIPFTDPMAEGPTIQKANQRALEAGATLNQIFTLVQTLRQKTQIPLVFLMYYNSLLHYGQEAFFAQCQSAGVDGVIIPDLPYDEAEEIRPYCERYAVYQIALAAPTSSERLSKIAASAKGFLYCVSSLGVTGIRQEFAKGIQCFLKASQKTASVPICVGFGISEADQVRFLAPHCDGIIVGSYLVETVARAQNPEAAIAAAGALATELRQSLDDCGTCGDFVFN